MSPKFIEFGEPIHEILDLCYIIRDPDKVKRFKDRVEKSLTKVQNDIMNLDKLEEVI
jgi:hypothetical protein